MAKKEYSILVIETDLDLNLDELCRSCHVTPDFIYELIEYGAIQPRGYSMESWRFDALQLRRVRRILRLQHDLEVNLPGAALAIDLMDQIEELKSQADLLKKHLFSSYK